MGFLPVPMLGNEVVPWRNCPILSKAVPLADTHNGRSRTALESPTPRGAQDELTLNMDSNMNPLRAIYPFPMTKAVVFTPLPKFQAVYQFRVALSQKNPG